MPPLPTVIGVVLLLAATAREGPAVELYERAFDALTLTDEQRDRLRDRRHDPRDPVILAAVRANREAIDLACVASHVKFGAWPFDRREGTLADLPWLRPARDLAALTHAAILDAAGRGDGGRAANLIDANLTLARRVGTPPTLLTEMVEVGIAVGTIRAAAEALPAMGDDAAGRVRDALDHAEPSPDMNEVIMAEAELLIEWLEGEEFPPDIFGEDEALTRLLQAAWADPPQKASHLGDLRRAAADLKAAAAVADPAERVGRLRAVDALEYGLLSDLLLGASDLAAEAGVRRDVERAMLRAAVAYRLGGPAAFDAVADPTTGEPFGRRREEAGFTVVSEWEAGGEPMTLTVPAGDEGPSEIGVGPALPASGRGPARH